MKSIKLIKEIKGVEIGTITRVSDLLAHKKVLDGSYSYVSKSEWRGQKTGIDVDKEMRKAYPANIEGSPEFNKANDSAMKEKKVKTSHKEKVSKEKASKKKHS